MKDVSVNEVFLNVYHNHVIVGFRGTYAAFDKHGEIQAIGALPHCIEESKRDFLGDSYVASDDVAATVGDDAVEIGAEETEPVDATSEDQEEDDTEVGA